MKNQIKLITGFLLVLFVLGSFNADAGHRNRRNRCGHSRIVVAPPILPILLGAHRCQRNGCCNRRNYSYNNGCNQNRNYGYNNNYGGRGRGRGNNGNRNNGNHYGHR
jgi:hypothetical protein